MLRPATSLNPVQIIQPDSAAIICTCFFLCLYPVGEIHNTHSFRAVDSVWVLQTDTLYYLWASHNQAHPGGGQGWLFCVSLPRSKKKQKCVSFYRMKLILCFSSVNFNLAPLCERNLKELMIQTALFLLQSPVIQYYNLPRSFTPTVAVSFFFFLMNKRVN